MEFAWNMLLTDDDGSVTGRVVEQHVVVGKLGMLLHFHLKDGFMFDCFKVS